MARPNTRPACGFADVRHTPERGYFCSVCGRAMGFGFRDYVELSCLGSDLKILDKNCPTGVQAARTKDGGTGA